MKILLFAITILALYGSDCPDDDGAIGFRFARTGFWSKSFWIIKEDGLTSEICAEACREVGETCIAFNTNGNDCFGYSVIGDELTLEKAKSYVRCSEEYVENDDNGICPDDDAAIGYRYQFAGFWDNAKYLKFDENMTSEMCAKACDEWGEACIAFNTNIGFCYAYNSIGDVQYNDEEALAYTKCPICPDDDGAVGYRFARVGYWDTSYWIMDDDNMTSEMCGEACDNLEDKDCIAFNTNAESCYGYYTIGYGYDDEAARSYIKCKVASKAEVDDTCTAFHFGGKKCSDHKDRDTCVTYYNRNENSDTMLDIICGWSLDEDMFGGEGESNCHSKPWIEKRDLFAKADFGKCNETLGGGGSSEVPTCGSCSSFDGDKIGCNDADPIRYCVDACGWDEDAKTCSPAQCSDWDGKNNIFKCTEKMAEKDIDCFFDITDNKCKTEEPEVSCDAYNDLDSKFLSKKACKELGEAMHGCEFYGPTQLCQVKGAKPACNLINGKEECWQHGCQYVRWSNSCHANDYVAATCSEMDGANNMYKCKKLMKKKDLDCYFDITDNKCKDEIAEVECSEYNNLGSVNKRKKGCNKLGRAMHNCSYNFDTRLCQVDGAEPMCSDILKKGACERNDCHYNKKADKCESLDLAPKCSDLNGASNMFECTKTMAKHDLECFFDISDNKCKESPASVSCEAYNDLAPSKRKEACSKLGLMMNDCEYNNDTKKCQSKGIQPACVAFISKEACERHDCLYLKETETCVDPSTVKCSEMDGAINMFECSRKMLKKDLTCYFDISDNKCKDTLPGVTCKDYNDLDESRRKEACTKLGEVENCEFSVDTKLCQEKGATPVCADITSREACDRHGCSYLKESESCADFDPAKCSDLDGAENMFDCSKKMEKRGLACYFDITDLKCKEETPEVTCADYNNFLDGEGEAAKEACSKLGAEMHNCEFSLDTKLCQVIGATPVCSDIVSKDACYEHDHCKYLKFEDACVDLNYVPAVCSDLDGLENAFECTKSMEKKDITCFFDITDNKCKEDKPEIACTAYNAMGKEMKDACLKLGGWMHNCEFNVDTKRCQEQGATPVCTHIVNRDACISNGCQYVKHTESCHDLNFVAATCSEMDGAKNMFECKRMMKKKDLDCYFDVTDMKCKDEASNITCDAYNALGPERKEACTKLGDEMHGCEFSLDTKLCQAKGQEPICANMVSKDACDRNNCQYVKWSDSCHDQDYVAATCSEKDGFGNMFECSEQMKNKDLDCYFDIKDNKCKDSIPEVSCEAYNDLGLNKRKEACIKLGKVMHGCAFSSETKRCQVKGSKPECSYILKRDACQKNGCIYLRINNTCTDPVRNKS